MSKNYLLFFILILVSTTHSFYSQSGSLTGIVKDANSGDVLPGANVYLKGTSIGSATDIEGNFSIKNIPVGNYTLVTKYIGFSVKEEPIVIVADRKLFLEISLKPDVYETEAVTVNAQAQGQVAAINQELNSNTIVNVISEEKIQELPDANAAEAIGRLPGVAIQREGGEANKVVLRGFSPEFSTITIDGVRISSTGENARDVDLSMISQVSLSGIELYKALTSDKDADAIAGSVNLVTKKAPSQRSVSFETKGLYNDLEESFNQYYFAVKYGERFFDDVLGVQVNGILEKRIRSDETVHPDYDLQFRDFADYKLTGFDLTYTDEVRKRNGVGLMLDINTPDNGVIKINNTFNATNRDFVVYSRLYEGFGGSSAITPRTYGINPREKNINSFNSSILGKNHFWGFDIDWGLAFNQSISETPYNYDLSFSEITNIVNGEYVSGTRPLPDSLQHGPPEAIIPYAVNNFESAYIARGIYNDERNIEINKIVNLDISRQYSFSDFLSGIIKFGGKYKFLDRSKNNYESGAPYYNMAYPQYEVLSDGSVVEKDLTGTSFENVKLVAAGQVSLSNFLNNIDNRDLFDKYSLSPLVDIDLVKEWYKINKNGSVDANGQRLEYRVSPTAYLDYYDLVERTSAGYIMNTLKFGNFATLITGLRIESESNDYASRYNIGRLGETYIPSSILDTTSSFNESIWLPNFQAKIDPVSFMSIRLAAYRALARPHFNYRLLRYSGTSGTEPAVSLGSPSLKSAKAWNYELSLSFYGNKLGLFTIGGYYKIIKDMYKITNGIPLNKTQGADEILKQLNVTWPIEFTRFALTVPYNSPKDTKVWGFELGHQINFLYLPGWLSGLVLSYNASISKSESYSLTTKVVSTGVFPNIVTKRFIVYEKGKLEGQPEIFGNVALGYDIGGFSGRVSLFYQDEYTTSVTGDGFITTYQNAYTKVDVSLKQKVTDNISVLLNINDLTSYEETTSRKSSASNFDGFINKTRYGLAAELGLVIKL